MQGAHNDTSTGPSKEHITGDLLSNLLTRQLLATAPELPIWLKGL
jgi:hypothetical protein